MKIYITTITVGSDVASPLANLMAGKRRTLKSPFFAIMVTNCDCVQRFSVVFIGFTTKTSFNAKITDYGSPREQMWRAVALLLTHRSANGSVSSTDAHYM